MASAAPKGGAAGGEAPMAGSRRAGEAGPQDRAPVASASLALAVLTTCLYWASLYLYVPVLAPEAHRLGAGVAGVGLVLAAYGFVQFLLRIPTGVWSDRIGRRGPFVWGALVASGVAALGMGLARRPWVLGLFRGVSGLGACGWVALTVLFAELVPPARAAWAFGVLGFLSTGSQLVASLVGGALARALGFQAPFLGAAGLAALGLAVSALLREPRRPTPAHAPTVWERLAVGRERRLLGASGLSVASHYVTFATTYGFTPLLAADRFRAGGLALGILTVCAAAPSALGSLAVGRLAARWPGWRLVAAGFVLAAAGAVAAVLAPSLSWLDAASALLGGGLGLVGPSLMHAAVAGFGPEARGAAMGFYQSLYAIGMFGGPAVAGWVGSALGLSGAFGSAAAVALVAAVAAHTLLAPGRGAAAAVAPRAAVADPGR